MAIFREHFDGRAFYNPNSPQPHGLLSVLRWKCTTRAERSPVFIPDVEPSVPLRRAAAGELRTTLVNHSTVLIQQGSMNILTDPIWSDRASPFTWVGPRRHRIPGVLKENMPDIDIILLSHNHYDHLDLATLHWLTTRGKSQIIVPVGVASWLRSQEIGPVHELDWGESKTIGATTIQCVPALHFAGRGLFDRNKSLWCGYVIQSQERTVYFAGDTAFGDHFAQIREVFGPPDLSFLPIGAYEPRWFMSPVHMAPEQALEAHHVLGSKTSVAIHHGTFALADDAVDTPRHVLLARGLPDSFLLLKNGETSRDLR